MQLVWLDAHLDLKEPVDGHVSHDVVVRELIEREVFGEDEIWIVDITRIDDDEQEFLENHDPRVFKFNEQERFQREFNSNEQPVYLSVDIDALEGIKGTGYPDGELSIDDVKEVIETVRPNYADLVEVAPPLDRDGKTAENAREILENLSNQLSP